MLTLLAVGISVAAQFGLIWVSGEVTKSMLPVAEGPNYRLRKFGVWAFSGFMNTMLVNLPPVFINLFLGLFLDAVGGWSDALNWTSRLVGVGAWAYPAWLVWARAETPVVKPEQDDAG